MFSVIGAFSLTIEPDTWTELAASVAAFVAARISEGVFPATPLPDEEDEPPQPARTAAIVRTASSSAVVKAFFPFIAAPLYRDRRSRW